MKNLFRGYIKRAKLIGALYCTVPTIIAYSYIFLTIPFREVYILRLFLSLAIGVPLAAYIHKLGISFYLAKQESKHTPSIFDGILLGGMIGLGIAFLPSLTPLIASNHIERAKTFVISAYIISACAGMIIGWLFARAAKTDKK